MPTLGQGSDPIGHSDCRTSLASTTKAHKSEGVKRGYHAGTIEATAHICPDFEPRVPPPPKGAITFEHLKRKIGRAPDLSYLHFEWRDLHPATHFKRKDKAGYCNDS